VDVVDPTSFQEYRIRGMVFHYVPTSADSGNGTSQALGSIMMQTTYRANDAPPTSKREILNEYWSNESAPCDPCAHPIECSTSETPFQVQYIRSVDVPSSDSSLLYDLGTTHIAVAGQPANGIVLGDLWVTYEVELKKPLVRSNMTAGDAFVYVSNFVPVPGTWATATMFDNVGNNGPMGNLPLTLSGRTVTFPRDVAGIFYVAMRIGTPSPYITGSLNWAGTPSVTGTVTLNNTNLDSYGNNDWEQVDTGTDGIRRNLNYLVCITKDIGVGSVTLPAPTSFSGSAGTQVCLLVFGTTNVGTF
jgi:hypothetical protein